MSPSPGAPNPPRGAKASAARHAKLTMTAPPAFRRSRRCMIIMSLQSGVRGADDGADDACVGAAAAEIAGQTLFHLIGGRLRGLREERRRRPDHSGRAVAALRRPLRG